VLSPLSISQKAKRRVKFRKRIQRKNKLANSPLGMEEEVRKWQREGVGGALQSLSNRKATQIDPLWAPAVKPRKKIRKETIDS